MKNILFLLAAVLFFGSSCSNVFENENDSVYAKFSSNNLVISNGSNEVVYYAVFEQGSLAVIDWVPFSSKENRILPSTSISVKKEDIYAYKDGKKVVLFYWKDTGSAIQNMQQVVID
tara:strand:+ start:9951 stop:10301 length:351 start_codon:yes stop_codon:yes gene_type:complete